MVDWVSQGTLFPMTLISWLRKLGCLPVPHPRAPSSARVSCLTSNYITRSCSCDSGAGCITWRGTLSPVSSLAAISTVSATCVKAPQF